MKSFIRFLSKHKLYALAEVIGLGVALAFVILVGSFVMEDNRCDRNTSKNSRLFMLWYDDQESPNNKLFYRLEGEDAVLDAIMQISSVEKVVSVMKTAGTFGPMTAETEAGEKEEIQALLVSQDYYDVFPSITLQGSFRPLAENMNSIMISEDFAARMFGDKDPVGESIVISEGARGSYSSMSKNYQICGVFRKPGKTIIPYTDVIFRDEDYDARLDEHGMGKGHYKFVLMKEGADLKQAKADFLNLKKVYLPGFETTIGPFHLEPFGKLHHSLYGDYESQQFDNLSDYDTFKIFLLTCVILLIFAVLNYIMLTIAFSRFRLKEMATRRLLGTSREGVTVRCFAESYLLLGLSFVVGTALALASCQMVSDLLDLEFKPMSTVNDWILMLASFVAIGFVAGIAPSFASSRHRPLAVIKGETRKNDKAFFGKVVIALQGFVCSAIIAVCAVVFLQTEKMMHAPRGYKTDGVVVAKRVIPYHADAEPPVSINEIESLPGVESVGYAHSDPAAGISMFALVKGSGSKDFGSYGDKFIPFRDDVFSVTGMRSTQAVFDMLGIKILETFHGKDEGDLRLYVQKSSWESFLSATESLPVSDYDGRHVVVAGIIDDITYGDVNEKTQSDYIMGYMVEDDLNYGEMIIKAQGNEKEAIEHIRQLFEDRGLSVDISTLGQKVAEYYQKERKYFGILLVFGSLAILLTVLGIVALGSYWSLVRSKDTSIRRIFGCSRESVFFDTVRSFAIPVLIGALLAVPFAYRYADHWLEQYLVRIDNSLSIYIFAVAVVMLAVLVSISFFALRMMNVNPVETLKNE